MVKISTMKGISKPDRGTVACRPRATLDDTVAAP
jgi:hypothetical protein